MFSAFQQNMAQNNAYQIGSGEQIDPFQILGNKREDGDWHYHPLPERQTIQKEILKAETDLIEMRQRAQEIRLRELAVAEMEDKYAETMALREQLSDLMERIKIENNRLIILNNNLVMLVLLMADPFIKIGGDA